MGSYSTPPDFPSHPAEVPAAGHEADYARELEAVRAREGGPRTGPRSWAFAPATYLLLGINSLVFLAMTVSHVSMTEPTRDQLLFWGANSPDRILHYGEWIRIVTAMFVHVGVIHLATNMWCLWNLGLLGEPLIGPVGVFAAYILSGAAGNLLSVAWNQVFGPTEMVGAGASGAVFGLAGVLIVLLKSPRLPIPAKELAGLRRYVIYFALINFAIGFSTYLFHTGVQIDNMAHLGGCIGGMIFALPLVPLLGSPRELFLIRRRFSIGILTCVLVLFGFFLSNAFPTR
jgi:rhomboid protease GluP